MARLQEMSVYLPYEDKVEIEQNAKDAGMSESEYVRSQLTECDE